MVLGILGFGAVVIAAYVFTVAARNYVSENKYRQVGGLGSNAARYIERSPFERRTLAQGEFPFTVNGILVSGDRRFVLDRRLITS